MTGVDCYLKGYWVCNHLQPVDPGRAIAQMVSETGAESTHDFLYLSLPVYRHKAHPNISPSGIPAFGSFGPLGFDNIQEESMGKHRVTLPLLALILAGSVAAVSCGAGQSQSQLQSMSLNPVVADAKDYPNQQVPFTATGYYVNPTHTVTPQSAAFAACQNGVPVNDVSVTTMGVAQCGTGASGAYSIDAWDASNPACAAMTACGGGCTIEATAKLTCP